jgi:ribosome-associated translation inhibitor RaiA
MNITLRPEEVLVETRGKVSDRAVMEARERIAALARFTGRPVLYAKVDLQYRPEGAAVERSIARAVLDINGHPLHAHANAESMHAAIVEIQERLRTRIERLAL